MKKKKRTMTIPMPQLHHHHHLIASLQSASDSSRFNNTTRVSTTTTIIIAIISIICILSSITTHNHTSNISIIISISIPPSTHHHYYYTPLSPHQSEHSSSLSSVSSPIVIREKPTTCPNERTTKSTTNEIVHVPGKVLEPPMRQVIIERIQPPPQPPLQDIIIEKWLDYPTTPKRNVIHQYAPNTNTNLDNGKSVKNLIIDWEHFNKNSSKNGSSTSINTSNAVTQKINYLGVETVDPNEYIQKHGDSLVEQSQLAAFINELDIKVPNGERLATMTTDTNTSIPIHHQHQYKAEDFIFTGDVKALDLLDSKQRNDLIKVASNKYLY
jgi:hypothetical protein